MSLLTGLADAVRDVGPSTSGRDGGGCIAMCPAGSRAGAPGSAALSRTVAEVGVAVAAIGVLRTDGVVEVVPLRLLSCSGCFGSSRRADLSPAVLPAGAACALWSVEPLP